MSPGRSPCPPKSCRTMGRRPTFSKASCLSQTCLFHDDFLLHIKNSGHLVDKRQIPAQKVLIKQKRLSSYKDRRKTCGTTLLHSKSRAPHCRMPTHSSALTRLARCAILSEDFYAPQWSICQTATIRIPPSGLSLRTSSDVISTSLVSDRVI